MTKALKQHQLPWATPTTKERMRPMLPIVGISWLSYLFSFPSNTTKNYTTYKGPKNGLGIQRCPKLTFGLIVDKRPILRRGDTRIHERHSFFSSTPNSNTGSNVKRPVAPTSPPVSNQPTHPDEVGLEVLHLSQQQPSLAWEICFQIIGVRRKEKFRSRRSNNAR